jgi:hypothetical protein
MECTIQGYDAERTDNLGMSDSQSYKYEKLNQDIKHLVYRQGAWRIKGREIVFTQEMLDKADAAGKFRIVQLLTEEQRLEIFQGEVGPQKVVDGITREKHTFTKVNILFGVKDEHYDFSF